MIEQELASVLSSSSAVATSHPALHRAIGYQTVDNESYMYREFPTTTTQTAPGYISRIFMEQTRRRGRCSKIRPYMVLGVCILLISALFVYSSSGKIDNEAALTLSTTGGGATIQNEQISMLKTPTTSAATTATASTLDSSDGEVYDNACYQECEEHKSLRYGQDGGDLLHVEEMLQLALRAKAKMIEKFKIDYGDTHFCKIFEKEQSRDESSRQYFSKILGNNYARRKKNTKEDTRRDYNIPYRGVEPVTKPTSSTTGSATSEIYDDAMYTRNGSGESLSRLKRKIYLKLLEVQMAIKKEESDVNGCYCVHGKNIPIEEFKDEDEEAIAPKLSPSSGPYYSHFVWATAGASIAAGRGNLFNETYTAFLDRAVKDVFASVGIGFEARNHAIGEIR